MSTWEDILSGKRRGLSASSARAGLRLASLPYAAAVRVRNFLFDKGWKRAQRASVPVFSIGNLSVGGTGKTPCVEWLVRELRSLGETPGILSRGYGAKKGELNDEARVLADNLADVLHVQEPDRVAGARRAVADGATCLVLDDGFQHRRLARDLDIVLIDATRPFGHGHVLPRGWLREGLAGLRRADWVLLTRAELLSEEALVALRAEVARWMPEERIMRSAMRPTGWTSLDGERSGPLEELAGQPLFLAAAIGNPAAFEASARAVGVEVRGRRWFRDHHGYTDDELEQLVKEREACAARGVLVTQKDAVKLRELPGAARLEARVLRVELEVEDAAALFEAVQSVLARGATIQESS